MTTFSFHSCEEQEVEITIGTESFWFNQAGELMMVAELRDLQVTNTMQEWTEQFLSSLARSANGRVTISLCHFQALQRRGHWERLSSIHLHKMGRLAPLRLCSPLRRTRLILSLFPNSIYWTRTRSMVSSFGSTLWYPSFL